MRPSRRLAQVKGGVPFLGLSDPDAVAAATDRYPVFRVDAPTTGRDPGTDA